MVFRRFLHALLLIFGVFALCSCGEGEKGNARDFGTPPDTDPAFAMKLAQEHVALGPKIANTPGAEKAASWIAEKMLALNGKVTVEKDSWQEYGKTFHNVYAVYKGQGDTGKFVIVGAHFDTKKLLSVPDFQGANDGASGVAALIAMANVLPERSPLPFDIRFVFFDGEECLYNYDERDGLHGSKHYAGKLKASGSVKDCVAMILLDMVGDKDLNVRFPADTESDLLDLAVSVSKKNGTLAKFNRGGPQMLDDHVPFQQLGIPAIDIIDFRYGPDNIYWHTAYDTLDKISGESIAASADFALDLIWALAKEQ